MNDALKNEADFSKVESAEKTGIGTYIVIGLGAVAVAALAAYQFFGCAGCY